MGKGGGAPTQTSSTVQNTNVPEYARPYVENMLGATQQQLFKMDGSNITGFQPYKAYGGEYDAAGNLTSYDPSRAIAGFSPLQQQAQQGIGGLQVPGEFGTAAGATQYATQQALGANYAPSNYGSQFNPQGIGYGAQTMQGYQMGPAERVRTQSFARPGAADAYMSPYMQNVVDIQKREAQRQSGIQGTQQQAQATQAGKCGRLRTQSNPQAGHLGEPPRDQSRTGVGAEVQAVAQAGGNSQYILDRTTHFNTGQIVAGINTQGRAVERIHQRLAHHRVGADGNQCGRFALCHFDGKARPAQSAAHDMGCRLALYLVAEQSPILPITRGFKAFA